MVPDIGDPTADPIADWEQAAWLHEALQQLPQPCRDLIIALYFDPTNPSYRTVSIAQDEPLGPSDRCAPVALRGCARS